MTKGRGIWSTLGTYVQGEEPDYSTGYEHAGSLEGQHLSASIGDAVDSDHIYTIQYILKCIDSSMLHFSLPKNFLLHSLALLRSLAFLLHSLTLLRSLAFLLHKLAIVNRDDKIAKALAMLTFKFPMFWNGS